MTRKSLARATAIALTVSALPVSSAIAAEDKRNLAVITKASSSAPYEMRVITADGAPVRTVFSRASSGGISSPSWSRDEAKLAYAEGGSDILLVSAAGGAEQPLTKGVGPAFSPASDEIAFWRASSGKWELRTIRPDGTGDRLVAGPFTTVVLDPPAWSPDGGSLAISTGSSLLRVSAGSGATTTIVAAPGNSVTSPALAPDGTRIAYKRHVTGTPTKQLVVRDLASGAEQIAWQTSDQFTSFGSAAGAISWSADSDRVAYIEFYNSGAPSVHRVVTVKSDGSGGRRVVVPDTIGIHGIAWANGSKPNYYVKHVEVAQAISPDLGPLQQAGPPTPGTLVVPWSLPSVAGFSLPLVAEKSTLVRIYVGDASLSPGATARRSLHFRVLDLGNPSIGHEARDDVDVTAPDVAPRQATERAALNVWLPPEAARAGVTNAFQAEINTDDNGAVEQECAGCYPTGNVATVQGVGHQEGGSVVIAPVSIHEITPESQRVLAPDLDKLKAAVSQAVPMLPIRDAGVTFAREPGPGLVIDVRHPGFTLLGACNLLLAELLQYRAMAGVAGPVEGFGATRWVGYAPDLVAPDNARVCKGKGELPGRNLVLLGPESDTFAHEFGHTLGLTHTTGRNPNVVPGGATALPYAGIGGVGYKQIAGRITEVFDKATTGDIMSYDETAWTSPKSWQLMHERILAESGATAPTAVPARARAAAQAPRTRRLVTGILQGSKTLILDAPVIQAATPEASGPRAARVVAKDEHGKTLAKAPIRGTPYAEEGQSRPSLPFVVALPDKKNIASLEIVSTGKRKPLARLRRSNHRPKGRLRTLPRRASARKPLTLSWSARDRDRRDKLSVAVLARRGNARWRTIVLGPAKASAKLHPKLLGKGRKLHLRLLVSDGLNTIDFNARPVTLTGRR